MGIPDHLICLLRNLSGQEATVRTRRGTTDWFQFGKGVYQSYILSLCLFNLCRVHHAKCWTDESQAGIRIVGRETSTTSDMQIITILLAESEEELKSLLMKVKEESEKADLKPNI